MSIIREVFVSYSRVDGEQPIFKLVENREGIETIKHSAPLFKRVGSIINVESTNEAEPILSIVCVVERSLRPDEPEAITQEVVQWLKGIGEWWT